MQSDRMFRVAFLLVLPALALWLVHARALDYAFTWTDASAIGQGTMLRPPGQVLEAFREPLHRVSGRGAAVRQPYYRPLQVVLLSTVDHVSGPGREPRAFRATAFGVASLGCAVFALLAFALLGRFGPALGAALWVAVHPVGLESTVWVAGVSGALCSLFVILALGLVLAALRAPGAGASLAWGVLSLLALLAGLLSKERAAVGPVLLIAGLVTFWVSGGTRPLASQLRRGLLLAGAHTALVGAYLAFWRAAVLGGALPGLPPIGGSVATQVLTALASWPSSLGWLFAPLICSTNDAVRIVASAADLQAILGALLALGSALAWWVLARRGRPLAAFGLAWVWIAFLPTSGLLPMLHLRGERYLYLSSFGAALLLADLAPAVWSRWAPSRRALGIGLAAVVLLGLAARTFTRLPDWESNRVLFQRELDRDPEYREGRFLLAAELAVEGRYREADRVLAPLLEPPAKAPARAGYLNLLALYELACVNTAALGRHEAVVKLEARAGAAVAAVPSFRACLAASKTALGRHQEALDDYLAVEKKLGEATPARLQLEIARSLAALRRRPEARERLDRASRAATGDRALQQEIERLRARLTPSRRGRLSPR